MGIRQLIHLVEKKNTINRRRRRFYYHMRRGTLSHISPAQSLAGYTKGKRDMKAMTADMRQMRKELNATFTWNAGGMITHVKHESRTTHHRKFKVISLEYTIDKILLGGE